MKVSVSHKKRQKVGQKHHWILKWYEWGIQKNTGVHSRKEKKHPDSVWWYAYWYDQ